MSLLFANDMVVYVENLTKNQQKQLELIKGTICIGEDPDTGKD